MRLRRSRQRAAFAVIACLAGGGAGFLAASVAAAPTLASGTRASSNCPPLTSTIGSITTGSDTTTTTTATGTTTVTVPCTTVTATTTKTETTTTKAVTTPTGTLGGSDLPPAAAPRSKTVTALQKVLNGDLNVQGGNNSALVIDENTDQTLWSYNANIGRLPASVEKLYTTSTALLEFGADATFQTEVLGTGKLLPGGIWDGTLYLRGGGDPTFGSTTFDHKMYGTGATVQALVTNLRAAGIREVRGTIVGDESYFNSRRGGPDTRYHENIETEGALSALAYDAGFTSLSETHLQSDPPLVATQAFVTALAAAHVTIGKGTRLLLGRTPADAHVLASVASPSLSTLLKLTNAPSDNFFAEMLLKGLGASFGSGGTTPDGAAVVRSFIASRFGLHPRLNDGSGLSRFDLTNTEQIVYLLRSMQAYPNFWNSLAVAGASGTMQDEMKHTRGSHNCRGKTGTLHDVANLVGYCTAANGDKLVFAFLMNGLTDSTAGHELEDLAGEALANYDG